MVMVQGLINSYGSINIAAYTSANKMEQLSHLPVMGVSMAISLFVGQNIGAGQRSRARKGLIQSSAFTMGMSAVMAAVIYAFGPAIMHLFVNDSDAEVIRVGAAFMRTWAPFILFHALAQSTVAFLRGSGDSVAAMIAMFFDLGVRTIAAYVFALGFGMGFMGIAYSLPCGWIGCAAFAIIRFFSGRWKTKAVVKTESREDAAE
jgi:Na+-driven multidrug efflux pump